MKSRSVLLMLSADFSMLPSNVNPPGHYLVPFDVIVGTDDGFCPNLSTRPGVIELPSWVIGERVSLLAGGVWAQDNTGWRQLLIKKNGDFCPGSNPTNCVPIPGTTCDFHAITAPIEVEQGDEFALYATQYSGGWLSLLASTGTFLSLTVL